MIEAIRNLTGNRSGHFFKSLAATCICDLANFGGFFFVIGLLYLLLDPYLGGERTSPAYLYMICAGAVLYMFFCYFASVPAYNANYVSTYNNSTRGRLRLAEHIRRLSLGTLDNLNPTKVSHSMMKDFSNLENANSHIIPQLFSSLLITVAVFTGLFFYNSGLAVSFFCCIPLALAVLFAVRFIGAGLSRKQMKASVEASSRLTEYIEGITTIKTNNMQGDRFRRFEESLNNLRKESIRLEVTLMPLALTAMSCVGAGIGIMVMYGQYKMVQGDISIMEFLVLMLAASRSIAPFIAFSINFMMLQYFSESGKNIAGLMNSPCPEGSVTELPSGCDLVMRNVSFSYDKKRKILDNVSLELRSGSTVAVVGPSGCGKSTLVKLLAGFYKPDEGWVLMGNAETGELTDISLIEPECLMRRYAMVFQDSYLFKGSVADNIRLGKKDASDEEILEVMRRAGVDFAMPDDRVEEAGRNFSGGERQRLCIARCMLKDAPVILLDEITSSLDVYNCHAMQKAVDRLAAGKTAVIIAHKLKNIVHSDLIIVMEEGRIAGIGKHEQLIRDNPVYRRLWIQGNNGESPKNQTV